LAQQYTFIAWLGGTVYIQYIVIVGKYKIYFGELKKHEKRQALASLFRMLQRGPKTFYIFW